MLKLPKIPIGSPNPLNHLNSPLQSKLLGGLATLEATHARRTLRAFDEKPFINFSSNDYLGLSQHPKLKQAAIAAIDQFGTGGQSSRLVSGTKNLHLALESAVASYKNTESALVFSSGYQANISLLQALCQKEDVILADKWNHASLVDGCRLAEATTIRYKHADMNHLEARLKALDGKVSGTKWIVTDSLFSMDGDWVDLPALVGLAHRYGAEIILDEAHASGLFGSQRASGLAEHFGVSQHIAVQMGTFSKGLGSFGGYVAGSQALVDWLTNKARGFIYTTAMPPSVVAANLAAIGVVRSEPNHREALWQNVAWLQTQLQTLLDGRLVPYLVPKSESQIIPITLGENALVVQVSGVLMERFGLWLSAIRPPTVPVGTARLRVSVCANHTEVELQQLVDGLSGYFSG
jgi:8-amino-7-oxononanoate synthase